MNILHKLAVLSTAFILSLGTAPSAGAQNLIPIPFSVKTTGEQPLVWLNVGSIEAPAELQNEREHLERILNERCGITALNEQGTARIVLGIDSTLSDDEAYTLQLNADGVRINGKTAAGVFYGLMTMEQLMIDNISI